MKYWEKYISQHLSNSSFSFNRSNREKMDTGSLVVQEKKQEKRKVFVYDQIENYFLFYSFMKHYKSDATQNILCGFKNLLKLFFSKKK